MNAKTMEREDLQKAANYRLGAILLGVGVLLAVAGFFLIQSIQLGTSGSILYRNLSPLALITGIVLIVQGVVTFRFKGRKLTSWFMAMPGVTLILLIALFPLFYSLILSFFDWNLQSATRPFVWFQNFGAVLSTPRVWQALARSFGIAAVAVGLEFLVGLGLALLLTDEFPGKGLTVIVIMTPLMMAPVVVGQVWRMLWDTRFGAINDLLGRIVGESQFVPWLGETKLALSAIIVTDVWQWTPFVMLIALAGFSAVNVELYEAAAIDGATRWQAFWKVTLPVVRPVLLVAFLFRSLDTLKLFDILYVLTTGGPGYSTETFPYYIYQQGFQYGRFSYTAAASYIFLILVVVISQVLIRRIGEV